LVHETDFTDRVSGSVDAQHVSDEDYLDDFSNDIEISSATYLPQEARLNYEGEVWDLEARAFAFQTVDPNIPAFREPYDRLPQITADADYDIDPYDIELEFEGEAINFIQSELEDGWRFDGTPSIKKEFETVWGYIEPKFSVRHTSYLLDRDPGMDDNLNRTLPVVSVDSGIFLERTTSWLDRPFIHTLEPRLFYVYIPQKNQDEFPNFDTGPINLNNFSNIYREYRFFGADRVGDTNQITAGLTSRMLDAETGNEWMSGSVGMIFFLEDREINLNPNQVLDESTSDFLAELDIRWNYQWDTYGYLQWDTEENQVREGKFDLSYRQEERRYVELSYRFSRQRTEQVRLESVWRVLPRWHLLFEDRYSLRDNENLETSVGLEYDGCCWRVRGFFQRRAESDDTYRNAVIFELELTGLANIRAGV
jgi:LPS-assembly protein